MNEDHKTFLAAMGERLSVSRYDCGTEYPVMIRGEMMETFCELMAGGTNEESLVDACNEANTEELETKLCEHREEIELLRKELQEKALLYDRVVDENIDLYY